MWRHVESDDFPFFAELPEFERLVALMAVENQQSMRPNSIILCMRVKVLQPLNTKLVVRPTVITDCDNLIAR